MAADTQTALVLSGGGARGAYAVGVVQGLIEILRSEGVEDPPFQIFSGTSVGSLNTAYLVAHAHEADLGIEHLRAIWSELDVNTHLRLRGTRQHPFSLRTNAWFSDSLFDPRPLELLVRRSISFRSLRQNVDKGLVSAAMVAAFDLYSAQTVIFAQYAPGVHARPGKDPSRREVTGPIAANHVLASSAMPFLFPAINVDGNYYCDGGVRFNTPISPAIRAGADRLVVVSLQYEREHESEPAHGYPTAPFIAGRLLNALMDDPFEYDLEVLGRFNRLVATLEEVLTPEELARVHQTLCETRGAPYRRLDKLVFSPSQDLGRLAHLHLEQHLASFKIGTIPRYFLKKAAQRDATWEADWAAYVLFDGRFAKTLIDLGYHDVMAQRETVREFFGVPGAPASHHRFD
jgi:NTE family protein